MSNVLSGPATAVGTTSVGELEAELQRRLAQIELQSHTPSQRHNIPPIRNNLEANSDRFFDRTIPQATTMILREAAGPLHVNEIYNQLIDAPGTFDLVIRDAAKAS